ncbi:putative ferric-chelate reductase [Starmerella bacillaris]|uniref:Ferric-chelate reductase n=1 Tax=Starmerella bacillaris TaxID=1247836 RepID=A0AAV5RI61_STABA|nr:putative ferric-chelate reductase [Starmerella bacillaris]
MMGWEELTNPNTYFRNTNGKWGFLAFVVSVALLILVVLGNSVLAPIFYIVMNERPSKIRNRLLHFPWLKFSLWIFTIIMTIFLLVETNDFNLRTISKRLGRFCVALMPSLYLVTIYPSPLPRSFYLQLLPIHKFISRVVVVIMLLHAIGYTYVYYSSGTLGKLYLLPNKLGILAFFVFLMMGVLSIRQVRRRSFELFYQSHVIGAWLCLPLLRWHSRPKSDWYLYPCLFMMIFQVILKLRHSTKVRLRVQCISPTLLLISIPKTQVPPSKFWNWPVCSHLRLSGPYSNILNWVRSTHPYTIASLPDDNAIKLVVRPGDYQVKMRQDYTIFGPHACLPNYMLHQIHSLLTRRVMIIVGGTGIAFGAPMMRYLHTHGTSARLIWAIRNPQDAKILPQLGLHDEVLQGNVEIYYTGEPLTDETMMIKDDEMVTIKASDEWCDEDDDRPANSREITKDSILSQYSKFMYNSRPHLNLRLKSWLYGYSLDDYDCCCADRVLDSCPEDRLGAWVFACGNPQMCKSAKKWAEDAGIGFFEDSFTL